MDLPPEYGFSETWNDSRIFSTEKKQADDTKGIKVYTGLTAKIMKTIGFALEVPILEGNKEIAKITVNKESARKFFGKNKGEIVNALNITDLIRIHAPPKKAYLDILKIGERTRPFSKFPQIAFLNLVNKNEQLESIDILNAFKASKLVKDEQPWTDNILQLLQDSLDECIDRIQRKGYLNLEGDDTTRLTPDNAPDFIKQFLIKKATDDQSEDLKLIVKMLNDREAVRPALVKFFQRFSPQ